MIADVAFHNLGGSNPHAHIMLSMRAITPDGFGEKVREWNDWTHAETWRGSWADHANRALANAGYQEEIDHRSYERQGLRKRLAFTSESRPVRWKSGASKQNAANRIA